jgi:ketosteroid isomerase-like protein
MASNIPDWIVNVFRDIDSMDADRFVQHLTEDAVFVYGSGEPVKGKEDIREHLGFFYTSLTNLQHRILDVWEVPGVVVVQLEGIYTLKDGNVYTIPILDLLKKDEELIKDWLIYADPSPMQG